MEYPGIPKKCIVYLNQFDTCYKLDTKLSDNLNLNINKYDKLCKNELLLLRTCIKDYYGDFLKYIR